MKIKLTEKSDMTAIKSRRIWELDFLRGICVLLMIWDHLMYDIGYMFGDIWSDAAATPIGIVEFAVNYSEGGLRTFFHPIIFCIFFVICGISCKLSKNNLMRGTKALILAFCITIFTSIIGTPIKFGVIHMLAFAMLIYAGIDMICRHNDKAISITCFVLGAIIIIVNTTYMITPPTEVKPGWGILAEFLNVSNYLSYDYFPLIPHVGYVLLGASIGGYWYRDKKTLLPTLDRYNWYAPINFFGRSALPAYILHQPVIFLILAIISTFIVPGTTIWDFITFS